MPTWRRHLRSALLGALGVLFVGAWVVDLAYPPALRCRALGGRFTLLPGTCTKTTIEYLRGWE